VRAAAEQFAHKPYSLVNLDDVVAAVDISRGAMYFHFPSKQALAMAVIDEAYKMGRQEAAGVLAHKLSGLETLIDLSYLVAVLDISEDMARAGMYLLESIGRAEGLEARSLRELADALAEIVRRAISEGDIAEGSEPADIARLLVSMYIGVRHTSDLDDPQQFLSHLEKAWALLLPGLTAPDRMSYFTEFIRRRTFVASGKVSSQPD
jgi:AcrR family transcriptional regulator